MPQRKHQISEKDMEKAQILYQQNYSFKEIERILAINGLALRYEFKKRNLPIRSRTEAVKIRACKNLKTPSKERLEILYLKEKRSSTEIGKMYGVTGEAIRFQLDRYRISIRKTNDPVVISQKIRKGSDHPNWKGGVRMAGGYIMVLNPTHPRAQANGYVHEAILVWENYHGEPFPNNCIVHHINGIRDDNHPENIMPVTRSGHRKFHKKKQGVEVH